MQTSISLDQDDINEAIKMWCEAKGLNVTERFRVSVNVTPGDRPWEGEYVTATVSGLSFLPPAP